jgi:AraC family transcriptional activator of mtrCDE
MQALNGWLRTVRAEGVVLVRTRVAGPWGFAVDPRDAAVFHFVAEGRAVVRQPDAKAIEVLPGELVLFPRGRAHEVAHSPRGKTLPLAEFMARRNGVADSATDASTLICGEFDIDRHLALPVMRALPTAVHLRAGSEPGDSALGDTLRLLRAEVETPNFGNQIVVRNLLSMLFVYFMREWAGTAAPRVNDWFLAVRTAHLARALACIHESPERAWTLEALAREAGLSRATFARQFNATVGEPPHNYLTRWRMGVAAQLLQETDLRLSEIAARVGYQSEFSFSRAFRRWRGAAPVRFRRIAVPGAE